jgi:hypothetical protein
MDAQRENNSLNLEKCIKEWVVPRSTLRGMNDAGNLNAGGKHEWARRTKGKRIYS